MSFSPIFHLLSVVYIREALIKDNVFTIVFAHLHILLHMLHSVGNSPAPVLDQSINPRGSDQRLPHS